MKTIIFCGGKGERLKPLTHEIPKPMVQIKGYPIIWYILKQLEKFDVDDIYIMVGYKSSVIKTYFNNNFNHLKIKIIDDGEVDIIERIKSAIRISPNEDALILYGDTISDVNIKELMEFSNQNIKSGTLTVWPLSTNFGVVEINEKMEITGFKEKPKLDKWINIGYFHLKKELFGLIYDFSKFEEFLKYSAESGRLSAFKHQGEHFTVNNLVELANVEQNIEKSFNF